MENLNLHKQKLYSLIVAAIAFITLLLPWQTYSVNLGNFGGFDFGGGGMGRSGSANGFRGWGWLSLIGIIAVIVASLMGDKTKVYDDTMKKVALGGFGLMAVGAVIFMTRAMSVSRGGFKSSPGFGLFICLVVALAGLALLLGLIKIPDSKPPTPPPSAPPQS
jgi:hypothetical protein